MPTVAGVGDGDPGERLQCTANLALEQRGRARSNVSGLHPRWARTVAHYQHGQVRERRHQSIQRDPGDSLELDGLSQRATGLVEQQLAIRGERQFVVHSPSVARLAQPRTFSSGRQARKPTL